MAFGAPPPGAPARGRGSAPPPRGPAPPSRGRAVPPPRAKPPWNPNFAEPPPPDPFVRESLNRTLPKYERTVHVGDRVRDRHSGREGLCLYVGPADFARGREVCGLRLDKKRSTTDCDGKYRGERHFRCTPGHGLYIPLDDAEFLAIGEPPTPDPQPVGRPVVRRVSATPYDEVAVGGKGKGGRGGGEGGAAGEGENFDLEAELEAVVGLQSVKDMLRGLRNAVE
ncbi:MAG: hypothetical protein SGPRY_014625, partial [Prymnesium sp.]